MNEQIKEMANDLGIAFQLAGTTRFDAVAEVLVNAGYRKQSEWISVTERLPEESACYLVNIINHFGIDFVTFTYYTKDYGWGIPDVTHWMPLPEPPEMKGGG